LRISSERDRLAQPRPWAGFSEDRGQRVRPVRRRLDPYRSHRGRRSGRDPHEAVTCGNSPRPLKGRLRLCPARMCMISRVPDIRVRGARQHRDRREAHDESDGAHGAAHQARGGRHGAAGAGRVPQPAETPRRLRQVSLGRRSRAHARTPQANTRVIVVDSSVWIDHFGGRRSAQVTMWDRLVAIRGLPILVGDIAMFTKCCAGSSRLARPLQSGDGSSHWFWSRCSISRSCCGRSRLLHIAKARDHAGNRRHDHRHILHRDGYRAADRRSRFRADAGSPRAAAGGVRARRSRPVSAAGGRLRDGRA
jgi:hypothetical protein